MTDISKEAVEAAINDVTKNPMISAYTSIKNLFTITRAIQARVSELEAASAWQPIVDGNYPKDESPFWAVRAGEEYVNCPNEIVYNPWIGGFSKDAGPRAKPVVHQPTHWMWPIIPTPPTQEGG